jgi:hypothetical protein
MSILAKTASGSSPGQRGSRLTHPLRQAEPNRRMRRSVVRTHMLRPQTLLNPLARKTSLRGGGACPVHQKALTANIATDITYAIGSLTKNLHGILLCDLNQSPVLTFGEIEPRLGGRFGGGLSPVGGSAITKVIGVAQTT